MAFLCVTGVCLLVAWACWSKFELIPIGCAFFVSSYSFWSEERIPIPFFGGNCEVGYFSFLAFWGCFGAIFATGRIYLLKITLAYVFFSIAGVFFLDFVTRNITWADVDFISIISWLISIWIYSRLIGRWKFWRHCFVAMIGAFADLFSYFFFAEMIRLDVEPDAFQLYSSNAKLIPFLVIIYSLPILAMRERKSVIVSDRNHFQRDSSIVYGSPKKD